LADVHPNRPPKGDEVEGFTAFIDARATAAEREEVLEHDPEEIAARARERRLTRWLVGMVLLIVVGSFTISILFVLITGNNGAALGF
jgi:hypothetical protein